MSSAGAGGILIEIMAASWVKLRGGGCLLTTVTHMGCLAIP